MPAKMTQKKGRGNGPTSPCPPQFKTGAVLAGRGDSGAIPPIKRLQRQIDAARDALVVRVLSEGRTYLLRIQTGVIRQGE